MSDNETPETLPHIYSLGSTCWCGEVNTESNTSHPLHAAGLTEEPEVKAKVAPPRVYTLIFAFTPDLRSVLLLRKATPYWQAGLWNGPGGKVEVRDSTEEAGAIRELREESGLVTDRLTFVLKFSCDCERDKQCADKGEHEIAVYAGTFSLKQLQTARGTEIEPVRVFAVQSVQNAVSYVPHLLALCVERLQQNLPAGLAEGGTPRDPAKQFEIELRSAKFIRQEFPIPTGLPNELYPQIMEIFRRCMAAHPSPAPTATAEHSGK